MAVTLEQVRRLLMPDEPNYIVAAKLGPQSLPHLRTLVNSKDQMLASKAAYLATLIDHEGAVAVLGDAAKSPSAVVRVAAASGARNVRHPSASGVVSRLLNDKDTGVRKMAIKAAADSTNSALLAQLGKIVGNDPSSANRALASHAISKAKGGGRIA
jgi:HEAT repeat protein